jgi:type III secretion system YscD/HrpQ family protein
MPAYLLGEEGPLAGTLLHLEEGDEWIIGRDPDIATLTLKDPMVSRKHLLIRKTPEGWLAENLSSVNPAMLNEAPLEGLIALREGDRLQIGSTSFRFTESAPFTPEGEDLERRAAVEELSSVDFLSYEEQRWLLKVTAGPNTGAEFPLKASSHYLIGKDPHACDIAFQDLSVSKQHARLTVDAEEQLFIEDLGSRNGTFVNGRAVEGKQPLSSQDLVTLGTTHFFCIDQHQPNETIIAPVLPLPQAEEAEEREAVAPAPPAPPPRDWKEMLIPKRHLVIAGLFGIALLVSLGALLSLFKTQEIVVPEKNEAEGIRKKIAGYTGVQFTFNQTNGKLFLVGHVISSVEKQELLYLLQELPYVATIEDNVVVDDLVVQNMNALLVSNPDWQAVALYAAAPGKFEVRGYVKNIQQRQALIDYLNINFPYLDRLTHEEAVEDNLTIEIQNLLSTRRFNNVVFQLANGEIVLSGRVDEKEAPQFQETLQALKELKGVRVVKNFVVFTTHETSLVDLSGHYQVTGFSNSDQTLFYVVINNRILSTGDSLDGMRITSIGPSAVLLERDGMKFKINYNLQ